MAKHSKADPGFEAVERSIARQPGIRDTGAVEDELREIPRILLELKDAVADLENAAAQLRERLAAVSAPTDRKGPVRANRVAPRTELGNALADQVLRIETVADALETARADLEI
ncbi:MAG: hypothetical protein FJW34_00100 [Acidobacteria bacterium]|nr:hypothetical protein [Acidobacteriota bacterium]